MWNSLLTLSNTLFSDFAPDWIGQDVMKAQARLLTRAWPLRREVYVVILVVLMVFVAPIIENSVFSGEIPETELASSLDTPMNVQPSIPFSGIASSYDTDEIGIVAIQNGDAWQGYNLFTMARQNRQTSAIHASLFIMDMAGEVLFSEDVGSAPPWKASAELIDPHTVLVGTETGAALWHIYNGTLEHLDFGGHHDYDYNPINDTFFTLKVTYEDIEGSTYRFDQIVEFDRNGTLVWSLNVSDFVSENWWCPSRDTRAGVPDITHANTIFYDVEEDILYMNARNINTFYKINHSTGEVIWGLGEYGDFTMFDSYGNEKQHLFFHAHSVERVENNTFILFDNDYHNQTSPLSPRSRMLEITVNETTMTANVTWFRNGPASYYSAGGGDADRLPDGNRLGTFGYWTIRPSGVSAALLEVDDLGNRVWRMEVPYSRDYMYGIYRSERFRMTPTLSSPSDSLVLPNAPTTLTWQAWYNYRNKARIPGIFELHIDGLMVQNGSFNYEQFWQPTNLSFDFSSAIEGLHNVTLFVSDGYGHFTNDTVRVYVGDFYVTRDGPVVYEKGHSESMIRWVGDTVSPLLCNVSVNGSSVYLSSWSGEDVLLDADSFSVGSHLIEFELFNGTTRAYLDSFWLDVHPSAPPEIQPLQGPEVSIYWNDTLTLKWELSDITPHTWGIIMDGELQESGTWSDIIHALNWTFPVLDEGEYNITVVAADKLDQISTSEITLTVNPPTRIILASSPGDMEIRWGLENVILSWEIHGVTHWELLKDDVLILAQPFTGGTIEYEIHNWRDGNWLPGTYSLTLLLSNDTASLGDTIAIDIVLDPGDPYADAVVVERSLYSFEPDNAVGGPDGQYAEITAGYQNGYLTLDMGLGEEIIDGMGADIQIVAGEGAYTVFVGSTIDSTFERLGVGTGYSSFNIDSSGLNEARYVRLVYFSGDYVEIDAVTALHHNSPANDNEPPAIFGPADFWIWENLTEVPVIWTAEEVIPWRYEILVNGTHAESGSWNGSDISFVFQHESTGTWNVTLALYDLLGHMSADAVFVEVRPLPGGLTNDMLVILVVGGLTGIGAATIVIFVLYRRGFLRSIWSEG
jgi:hypothetical protein